MHSRWSNKSMFEFCVHSEVRGIESFLRFHCSLKMFLSHIAYSIIREMP